MTQSNLSDNYIVRIYRRNGKGSQYLVGVVEEPVTQRKEAFTSAEELWEILHNGRTTKTGKRVRTKDYAGKV